jgi:RHS repeat-associated protein
VTRTEPGPVTTQIVFDGGLSIIEFTSTASSPTVEYIRGHDYGGGVGGLEYTMRDGVASFNFYDSRGDVTTKTNASGTVTYQTGYEAFGNQTVSTGTVPADRQRASTKEQDPTGLLNEGFRYRDPSTGTFLTRDPLGFKAGPNMYTYVHQNPWTHFDPEGLFIWGEVADLGFAAYDTWSAVTAKNQTERNWAYANLAVDLGGAAIDVGDAGAGGGFAVAMAGRAALKIKQAAEIAKETKQGLQALSAAGHTGEVANQMANDKGTGGGSSDVGGKSQSKVADTKPAQPNTPKTKQTTTTASGTIVPKVQQAKNFDEAREKAFENAGMTDPTHVTFSKTDPKTGTATEFKGSNGAKVGYDAPHADASAELGHDKPHVSWQTAGKRSQGGAGRGNITYEGPQHPSRASTKTEGTIQH